MRIQFPFPLRILKHRGLLRPGAQVILDIGMSWCRWSSRRATHKTEIISVSKHPGSWNLSIGRNESFFRPNGQGKTNSWNPIYLLAYGKSFSHSTFKDCIQHGKVNSHRRDRSNGSWPNWKYPFPWGKKLFVFGKPALDELWETCICWLTNEHLSVVRGDLRIAEPFSIAQCKPVIRTPCSFNNITCGRSKTKQNPPLNSEREKKLDEGSR